MKPSTIPHLAALAAKNAAVQVPAVDLLAEVIELKKAENDRTTIYSGLQAVLAENEQLKQRIVELEAWSKRAYFLARMCENDSLFGKQTKSLMEDAPDVVREE